MNLKCICSLLLVLVFFTGKAQNSAKWTLSPYVNFSAAIKEKDALIEGGIEVKDKNVEYSIPGNLITITCRVPLTENTTDKVGLDRNFNNIKLVAAYQRLLCKKVSESGPVYYSFLGLQGEYGPKSYKFNPFADKNEEKVWKHSLAAELKLSNYWLTSPGGKKGNQFFLQTRVRYEANWKETKATGVVAPSTSGLTTVTNYVLKGPDLKPKFSPAVAFSFYTGTTFPLTYTPAFYYDFTGHIQNSTQVYTPFNNSQRFRFEFWFFYYPTLSIKKGDKDSDTATPVSKLKDKYPTNIKIGLAPYISVRTRGEDDLNRIEGGVTLTLKFNSSFMQMF